MIEQELAAIEERCAKATPGPWEWRGKSGTLHTLRDRGEYQYGKTVLAPIYEYDSGVDVKVSEADADFIAYARTDVETLVAEIRRLREFAAEVDKALADGVASDVLEKHAASECLMVSTLAKLASKARTALQEE